MIVFVVVFLFDEVMDFQVVFLELWQVVVWNDFVNFMSYVVWVFCIYFGYFFDCVIVLMFVVYYEGYVVVVIGLCEMMEVYVQVMYDFGLWVIVRKVLL